MRPSLAGLSIAALGMALSVYKAKKKKKRRRALGEQRDVHEAAAGVSVIEMEELLFELEDTRNCDKRFRLLALLNQKAGEVVAEAAGSGMNINRSKDVSDAAAIVNQANKLFNRGCRIQRRTALPGEELPPLFPSRSASN